MARESAGIEVFGRGVTTVDDSPRDRGSRTPALGAASILLAILAAAAFAAAVIERSRGSDFVEIFTVIALGGSALAAFAGLAANPWLLGRVLEYAASLPA